MSLIFEELELEDLEELGKTPLDPVVIDFDIVRRRFSGGFYLPDFTPLGPYRRLEDAESNWYW